MIAVEWLNQNSLRNFPFREDCGLRPNDSAGTLIEDGWRLPNYFITDIVIGVAGANYTPIIYLKRLSLIGDNLTLVFADSNEEDVFTVGASSSTSMQEIAGTGSFRDARGVIHFGDLTRFFSETPEGLYTFSPEETYLEPTCIRPSALGIRSISVVDSAGYTSKKLQGDIKLIAGDNIHLKVLTEDNAIVISADPDSGYTLGCECQEDTIKTVKTINGLRADDVEIVGVDCVAVTTNNGVIEISDTCSKPCCGCAETAFINQSINDLQSSVTTLTSNTAILAERVTSFINSYLLARKTLA